MIRIARSEPHVVVPPARVQRWETQTRLARRDRASHGRPSAESEPVRRFLQSLAVAASPRKLKEAGEADPTLLAAGLDRRKSGLSNGLRSEEEEGIGRLRQDGSLPPRRQWASGRRAGVRASCPET